MALIVLWLLASVALVRAVRGGTLRIIAFGDSTTASRPDIKRVYAQRLAPLLATRGIKADVINAGRAGYTTAHARERFELDVLNRDPDLVIIQYGLNDSAIDVHEGKTEPRVPQSEFERNLNYFIDTLKARGSRVILMTPNPMFWTDELTELFGQPPYDVNDRWGFNLLNVEYAESVRRIAKAHNVPLIDVYRLYRDYDRVKGQAAENLLTDGIHPDDDGHRMVAELLAEQIAPTGAARPAAPSVSRGYSIPLIDLADQQHRQVIVDREDGQYLGHPTTVLLEDNQTMIVVYPKGHGRGAIVMKRSTDAGLTWSERLPVPENWATSKEVPTIHRVVDRDGAKRLILFSGLYPIRMAISQDDGITWTPLEPIGDFGGIVVMATVERLKNGDYMALFHDDGRFLHGAGQRTKFQVFKTISKDGGLTWGAPVVIAEHPRAHLCEPGLIRSPDGKQIALLLRENSRKFNSFVIFSNDEGRTWSEPRELPGALTGDRHTGKYAPDGRLFISFRDTTHESKTQGDWVGWVGTYDDLVRGREGQYRVRLMNNHHKWDCAYPAVEILPDGTYVVTTYGHWIAGQKPYIVSVRFKLEELDALATRGE